MLKLLVLADDFTGSLDSGVQLAKAGAETHVTTDVNISFDAWKDDEGHAVVVIDTESRHLSAAEARKIVRNLTERAVRAGVKVIYKKTDSALRGNIGAELDGALNGSGASCLHFIPAFPKLKRTTSGGKHYIDGVPVNESVFGEDPFDPVKKSFVPDIIALESIVPVHVIPSGEKAPRVDTPTIMLYDAASDEDLERIADGINLSGTVTVISGCAGFAGQLPRILGLIRPVRPVTVKDDRLFIVSGSLNPITDRQVEVARGAGFDSYALTSEQMQQGIPDGPECDKMIQTILQRYERRHKMLLYGTKPRNPEERATKEFEEKGKAVAANMGSLMHRLYKAGLRGVFAITGGDILKGTLKSLNCTQIAPLCEVEPGVVLSSASIDGAETLIVSKSGGFGSERVFLNIAKFIQENKS